LQYKNEELSFKKEKKVNKKTKVMPTDRTYFLAMLVETKNFLRLRKIMSSCDLQLAHAYA